MVKKIPKINLAQTVEPRIGDMEKLFATMEDTEQVSGLQLMAVRMDAIQPDPDQPRRTFPETSLLELSESIKQEGVIQPIEVTQIGPDAFMIVHGERRWRSAKLAGLETIPAVVRRQDYDSITRIVRQLVENIQREDLNDVDRAAGLLRLRDLMKSELESRTGDEEEEGNGDDGGASPWAKTVTWAKVGKRLGYSRQRIHQLIQLLDLPEEIKQDVRDGRLSERDTRVYQGLQARQQRELHRLRYQEDLNDAELRLVARYLKAEPGRTVSQAIREIRHPLPDAVPDSRYGPAIRPADEQDPALLDGQETFLQPPYNQNWVEGSGMPAGQNRPSNVDRLVWVRGHLARTQRQGLTQGERRVILRLLNLIQQDVKSLIAALQMEEEYGN